MYPGIRVYSIFNLFSISCLFFSSFFIWDLLCRGCHTERRPAESWHPGLSKLGRSVRWPLFSPTILEPQSGVHPGAWNFSNASCGYSFKTPCDPCLELTELGRKLRAYDTALTGVAAALLQISIVAVTKYLKLLNGIHLWPRSCTVSLDPQVKATAMMM